MSHKVLKHVGLSSKVLKMTTTARTGGIKVDPKRYPVVRRDEEAGWFPRPGRFVPEPYAYLEDPDSEETEKFVSAQNELTESVLNEDCPARESYKTLLTKLMDYPKTSPPRRKGKRWFYYYNTGLQAQSVLFSQGSPDEPHSASRVLLDPNNLSEDGTVALSSSSFSKDGTKLAYCLSSGGSDWVEMKVMKIGEDGSSTPLDDHLKWVKFTSIAWTHDGEGFFYNSYPSPWKALAEALALEKAGTETGSNTNQRLMYHKLGQDQSQDTLIWEAGATGEENGDGKKKKEQEESATWMMGAEVSDDGKWCILTIAFGCDHVNQLHMLKLGEYGGLPSDFKSFRESSAAVVENFDAEYDYVCNEGDLFTFRTNLNAPRGKLVQVDISDSEKYNRPETWKVLIEEQAGENGAKGRDVLEWARASKGDHLVVCYLQDARHVLQLRSLQSGKLVRAMDELPVGSVAGFTGNREDSECFIKLTGFTSPGSIYWLDTSSGAEARAQIFKETELNCGDYKPEDLVTEQVFVKSKDGTEVPMFIVGPRTSVGEFKEDESKGAALLYGYGGFNISLTPSFSASRLAWMMGFGSVMAIANLRGGGEYGEEWHKAGTKLKKQNVFDDFQACGEHLIREGYCSEDKLAIEGGSNGGLLVGACLNQRPDLFSCGIAHVGVMDMMKFQKFTIGHAWCTDFGNAEESDEMFEYLQRISPLHNVPSQPTTYPSTMILTGDHDDRVVPLHSLKFIAELQYKMIASGEETEQTNPLIARIETRAGHGAGKPTKKVIQQCADVYSFVAASTNTPWKKLS